MSDACRVLQPKASPDSVALLMVSLFQHFEFSYPDGFLFFGRSGALARRLQGVFHGLTVRNVAPEQFDFAVPGEDMECSFGSVRSRIQTLSPGQAEFPKMAASLFQTVSEVLELGQVTEFRFRHVLGRPCADHEEAQRLMWPFVGAETKEKLQSINQVRRWDALQAEFTIGPLACQTRIAILEITPHRRLVPAGEASPAVPVPHITYHVDYRGTASIDVAELDVAAFIQKVCKGHTEEILDKLAPHLRESV